MNKNNAEIIDSKNIRVLVSGALPPPEGGIGTYFQSLLRSSLPEKVNFHFIETSAHRRNLAITGRANFSNILLAIQDCARYTKAVITLRPEIAHIATAFGFSFVKHASCVWIARFLGIRVLLNPRCGYPALYENQPGWWQWFVRTVLNWTSGIIVLSKEWFALSQIYPAEKIHYLPIAVDLRLYEGIAEKRFSGLGRNGDCKVLYLGYLGHAKGTFDLLEAASILQKRGIDMTFDLVGNELTPGEMIQIQDTLNQNNLGSRVKLCGPAYGEEKLQYLQDADIFVYPSYSEGLPNAVIEAMSCGLPIVASCAGGLPDLVKEGVNGLLVQPGHPIDLADALEKLYRNPTTRASMQKASYLIAQANYDMERHVDSLIEIYRSVSIDLG